MKSKIVVLLLCVFMSACGTMSHNLTPQHQQQMEQQLQDQLDNVDSIFGG